jgi:hypothetical protein
MLSIFFALSVFSAYACCYYAFAQPKHNVTTRMLSIRINFPHFSLVTMLILSICVVTVCAC